MTQQGIITQLLNNGKARVCVTRLTACGGNCSGCESCMLSNELTVDAVNGIGAITGQKVVIESSTAKIFKAVVLVYLLPVLMLLLGYFLGAFLGLSEGICILLCFSFLLLSAGLLVIVSNVRKRKAASEIVYNITGVVEEI